MQGKCIDRTRKRTLGNNDEQGDEGDEGHMQGEDTVKLIKPLRLRWYGHVERMQNQRMPKQIASATTG
jgi:hypothetical protein